MKCEASVESNIDQKYSLNAMKCCSNNALYYGLLRFLSKSDDSIKRLNLT